MTDKGEPGSSDTIGITVWNKSGGLWFSSNWTGVKTVEQVLGGGNLVVHDKLVLQGQTLTAAASADTLTPQMLKSALSQAFAYWWSKGVSGKRLKALSSISVQVADLPDGDLGWGSYNSITLDTNAAGHGWFLGKATKANAGKVDLATVIAHELGHVLGIEHSNAKAYSVMQENLAPGSSPVSNTPLAVIPALDKYWSTGAAKASFTGW